MPLIRYCTRYAACCRDCFAASYIRLLDYAAILLYALRHAAFAAFRHYADAAICARYTTPCADTLTMALPLMPHIALLFVADAATIMPIRCFRHFHYARQLLPASSHFLRCRLRTPLMPLILRLRRCHARYCLLIRRRCHAFTCR